MMGSISDPVDGAAVAGSIWTAVIVYAVRLVRPKPPASYHRVTNERVLTNAHNSGLLRVLRSPGSPPRPREPTRRHHSFVEEQATIYMHLPPIGRALQSIRHCYF